MTHKSLDHCLAPDAKRLIRLWANDYAGPEESVLQRDVAKMPVDRRQEMFQAMSEIAGHLRKAFETADEYERDWFLFMARHSNAVYNLGPFAQLGRMPGTIPMARGTRLDRAISFAQRRLLTKHMAVCRRKHCDKKYYFRTRKGQKYCSKQCSRTVLLAGKRSWFLRVGSQKRRERATT